MTWDAERVWVSGEEFPYGPSQIKKAGERIRRAVSQNEPPLDDDLELLDLYRSSHYPTLRHVQERLVLLFHKKGRLDPQIVPITARPLKTREATIEKLIREKARLNRIHDIAGARIVVPSRANQDAVLWVISKNLSGLRPEVAKDCREQGDKHGYRAVHVVVATDSPGIGERYAEIQIRTRRENAWAQLVERLDAIFKVDLKHGRGPAEYLEWLKEVSAVVGELDSGGTTTIRELPPFPALQP